MVVMEVMARPATRLQYTWAVAEDMSGEVDTVMDMQLVISMYRKVEIHSAAIDRQKESVLK